MVVDPTTRGKGKRERERERTNNPSRFHQSSLRLCRCCTRFSGSSWVPTLAYYLVGFWFRWFQWRRTWPYFTFKTFERLWSLQLFAAVFSSWFSLWDGELPWLSLVVLIISLTEKKTTEILNKHIVCAGVCVFRCVVRLFSSSVKARGTMWLTSRDGLRLCFLCVIYVDPITEDGIISSSLTQSCQSLRRLERKLYFTFFIFYFFNNMIALRFPLEVFVLLFFRFLSFFLIFTKSRSLKREPLALVQRQHCT